MIKTNIKRDIKTDRKYVNILGINIISRSRTSLLSAINKKITDSSKFYIVTPGPEQILRSIGNSEYKKALNSAAFAIPDSIGLAQAAKYNSLSIPKSGFVKYISGFVNGLRVGLATFTNPSWLTGELEPIKGRIFFWDLIDLANKNSWKVFLLGGENGEGEASSKEIFKKYKKIKVKTSEGPIIGSNAEPVSKVDSVKYKDAVDKINEFGPQILFVAFGDGNPKQELWIYKNLKKLKVNCVMPVGGTFRYVAGLSKLPPKWMEGWGEWLWRLITEPHRFKRIFNAFPLFPLRVFLYKIFNSSF